MQLPLTQSYVKKLNSNYLGKYKPNLPMLMIKSKFMLQRKAIKGLLLF